MIPPVALTLGDPAGIGGEIALRAWAALGGRLPFFLIGDRAHVAALGARLSVPVVAIDGPEAAAAALPRGLPVLSHPLPRPAAPGVPDPANAATVVAIIERGVALVRSGRARGALHQPDPQEGAEGRRRLRLSRPHRVPRPPLRRAAAGDDARRARPPRRAGDDPHPARRGARRPDAGASRETIRVTHAALVADFGLAAPRIAVAGLNPHAGEGGAIGGEEIAVIAPVLDRLRAEGMALTGPHSADTLFHAAARARYDAAVCMYHDQALIPIKTIAFDAGVNVTLGLDFVRTSPDHGTAYDIAADLTADPSSLVAALEMAAEIGAARARAR